ncbi:actin-domain-containing protein [Naematelia encephala]|uniref:Actin-domain-containing protein n=1 Tax=Naematelia encephala TaxID=71784 RepID=A0A1Y2BJC2_9TREE|nr:actin-domain-containing protein [Naematelia encephala]
MTSNTAVPDPSSAAYSTPTKRAVISASAEAGPSRARPAGASPAYSSRRHSLYGIEDRVIIDPGSRIWRVGFSGEPDPRAVYWTQRSPDTEGSEAWTLDLAQLHGCREDRKEAERLISARCVRLARDAFTKHLMTDAKTRKVVVLENTFLPTVVKEQIAAALFDNLKVPSISFTPSCLLALAACGRITGLVVDIGWLETTITPVYCSRPLDHLARSTTLAGKALHDRLRLLLQHHATYIPPPASMSNLERRPVQPVPEGLLSDRLLERILTEGCFVGSINLRTPNMSFADTSDDADDNRLANMLRDRYRGSATATDLSFRIDPPESTGLGPGLLLVPGWIRERAAELLFGDDIDDEQDGIPESILHCISKLPVDLRPTLISSLLITGGTASLPGLIPRLRVSLLRLLLPSPSLPETGHPINSPAWRRAERAEWRKRHTEPFRSLYGLSGRLAILNDPAPLDTGDIDGGGLAGGRAPRWTPGLLSWVGGSLAGALKTGAPEMTRETYDTLFAHSIERGESWLAAQETAERDVAALVGVNIEDLKPGMAREGGLERKRGWKVGGEGIIGDWTRVVRAG